ncbi:hypothetical protein BX616_005823 [Lobosporangium transversale]|uniref:GCS light chain n=1 Tax=Lobosporangium transversale TaxID=64571 RepID=A0A1Y2GKP2_9FUNG|nr:hypothetical protein BCR41DRAFT_422735 [Lobosporangium transversale]KAF9915584.1 hypothetical protein BX616_005823 [Lobosporangium transversale]ORZ13833.1 hypothetical protein BCR41DRAFT_422735 [Lobosporangium transversale]|eukprot:XP_021880617.1 hypothetical protein BCR41DRAFT_422735 [Lobosporangium transversale]
MAVISSEAHSGELRKREETHNNGSVLTSSSLSAFANHNFSHLTLYTGNTMRTGTTGQLNTNLKKSNQELVAAVQDTLYYSLSTAHIENNSIIIRDETSIGPLEADRSSYEITVKMFYLSSLPTSPPAATETGVGTGRPLSVDYLRVAFTDLEYSLGIPDIKLDTFILALPNQVFDENGLDALEFESFRAEVQTMLLPVWKQLSLLRNEGRIGRLGVAEFSKQQLEVLKEVAAADPEGVMIAPEVNQVNLQDCCVLPKDLIQYAKEEGIELLTHGDLTNILPQETFALLLKPYLPVAAEFLVPNFVLKYSAFITCRGVVTKKGYIIDASSV